MSSDEALKRTLDEAEWSWLKPHVERDAVIVVAHEIDLLQAARAVAGNDSQQVQAWLARGILSKPTKAQLAGWDETPQKRFLSVVVQPFVLIQELLLH